MTKRPLPRTITIMVPALNEEGNLANTVSGILSILEKKVSDYEILIFNDGSTDLTGKIANQLAKKYKKVKAFHNRPNQGMGYCYRKGLELAKFEYYMYIPGDNQFPKKALEKMVKKIGQADIINPYVTNMHIRPLGRQLLSHTFTLILNSLFRLEMKYYNGTVIHRTKILRQVPPSTDGFAYQAEVLTKLIKSGASFTQVSYEMVERQAGSTAAFKLKNIKSVFQTILKLYWEMMIKRRTSVPLKVRETFLNFQTS